MNKPRPTQLRPLAEVLRKTLTDAFAKQGFASVELVTRWREIVGAEIAAHSQPEKIQWPRTPQARNAPVWHCRQSPRRPPVHRRRPPILQPNFRRHGECPMASRSLGGSLTRAGWGAQAWRWSAPLLLLISDHRGSKHFHFPAAWASAARCGLC